ncbi:MAG TPA: hypothetical protein VGZ00_01000 [Candidatus Baltobacteraceae bacterium]|nr:hypothetical protein [Candidatus Baltobacteraceae bacterium]
MDLSSNFSGYPLRKRVKIRPFKFVMILQFQFIGLLHLFNDADKDIWTRTSLLFMQLKGNFELVDEEFPLFAPFSVVNHIYGVFEIFSLREKLFMELPEFSVQFVAGI